MTCSYSDLSPAARRQAAHSTLDALMTRLGAAGLDAAAALPGLLAEVDQHVADVVDALSHGGRTIGLIGLAGYAAGARDAALEQGWRCPDLDGFEWSRADWALVRLVSVCGVARAAGYAG